MPDDVHGMRLALAEAERAYALGEVPIGAVILDETGTVIASGYNLRETQHDATAHAELLAIQRACQHLGRWRLTGMTLYVTIEPCPMCHRHEPHQPCGLWKYRYKGGSLRVTL